MSSFYPPSEFSILLNPALCPKKMTSSEYINITLCCWLLSDFTGGTVSRDEKQEESGRGWFFPRKSPCWAAAWLYSSTVRQSSLFTSLSGSPLYAESLSHVWLFVTPPESSVQYFPGKNIGVVATSYSRGSSQPRDWTHVSCISCIGRQILYHWATWEAQFFVE